MYRDLLVHVDGSQAGRRRVQFAVDLAMRMTARLAGLHVTPPVEVPHRYKPSLVPKVAAELSSKLASDARAAATVFQEDAIRRLPDACWFETAGDVVQGISDKARYADLVILGQYERQGPAETHPLPIAHSLAVQCGRPVLLVPGDTQPGALEKVAIAWDGSREAVRAVHDALPLLRLARSVQIVTMHTPSAENSEEDEKKLSEHLTNHGIHVDTGGVRYTILEEHEALRKQIEQGHFDLLVMGGYSHPLWLEILFGGATRSILLSSTIPVLVSH